MFLKTKIDYEAAVSATIEGGKPLVINFLIGWQPPCKKMGQLFQDQVANYPELTLKKLDVEVNNEASQAAGVKQMPCFKVYKNGAEVNEMRGVSEQGLINLLN